MRTVAKAAAVAGMVGASMLVGASPAAAAPPPSCVTTEVFSFNSVRVHNNCSGTANVRVIWANARDSACRLIHPWTYSNFYAYNQPFASYQRTDAC